MFLHVVSFSFSDKYHLEIIWKYTKADRFLPLEDFFLLVAVAIFQTIDLPSALCLLSTSFWWQKSQQTMLSKFCSVCGRSFLSSRRAESARAVTGRRCPLSGVGEDFLAHRPSCRGLKMDHWRYPGSYGKKRIFGPKSKFSGPKKTSTSWSKPCSSNQRAK